MHSAYYITNYIHLAGPATFAAPLLIPLLPARVANRHPAVLARLAGAFCLVAASVGLLGLLLPDPVTVAVTVLTLRVDGFASLLLVLTGFIGWIVSGYARTHLRDEVKAGDFQKWIVVATGGAAIAVMATDLLTLAFGLLVSGAAMQPLLTHYGERAAARQAARMKFIFNRIADASLLLAAYFAYRGFGTVDLETIASTAATPEAGASTLPVAILIALAAVIRSVQIPFHGWLPGTVEAPVPVSALMHAGIVNGGGILLIRSAGIITQTPPVMIALFLIGATTAVMAALITVSQANVKQQLVFSTVAQMGFMVMECGIGAFTAATLHIVAHSLYKAHAFLNSGNALMESTGKSPVPVNVRGAITSPLVMLGVLMAAYHVLGLPLGAHAGGLLLGFIIGLAALRWWHLTQTASAATRFGATILMVGVLVLYALVYRWLDSAVGGWSAQIASAAPPLWLCIAGGLVFYALSMLESLPLHRMFPVAANAIRVHAGSGFYIDQLWRCTLRNLNR